MMRNTDIYNSTIELTHFIAAVERAGLKPEDVQEVFVGNVLSAKYELSHQYSSHLF
jgi:hypothetical protein